MLKERSKFQFSDFVGNALLYTIDENVKNIYDNDTAPVIDKEYINDVTSPYLNDIEWDVDNQTLNLTYIDYYNAFFNDLGEYDMDYFLGEVDPNLGINGDWICQCDDYLAYVYNSAVYSQNIKNPKSIMWNKIKLYIQKFDEYVDYLSKNLTPVITSEKIYLPCTGETEYKFKPILIKFQHDYFELKTFSSEKNAYPSPAIKHKFYIDTNRMLEELKDICTEMHQYAFPPYNSN